MELKLKMLSVHHIGDLSKSYSLWAFVDDTWCCVAGFKDHKLLQLFTHSWEPRQ